ncbi:MAG TPA: glycosyltransferase family 4 protein [Acidobacteriota bacterium]|nr:glycosyltransferase family 4 protein [Acidobacteriota bacterium]
MKIAYISAGSAGMYCGSCIHDNTLASALMELGHDVALIPTYTPMRTDEDSVAMEKIFFGGINIYLQHKSSIFRHMPRFLERWLNSPKLLKYVSRFAGSTNAHDLGGLTADMLHGEAGHLKRELDELTGWLRDEYRPDIIVLTNSMLLGLARQLRKECGVPVLCELQGEDIFIDDLIEPYKSEVMKELYERSRDVDGFIATSEYYADYMAEYLHAPRERVHIVPLGIHLEGHGQHIGPGRGQEDLFTIGFLARVCPEKGLHLLAEAFRILAEKLGRERVRLRAAGWLGEKDRPYLEELEQKIESWGLGDGYDYAGEVDRQQKIAFLSEVDVLCVPTVYREPKGLFALEALANGTPVVLPDHGALPELVDRTRGGILVKPNDPASIAAGLESLYHDPARREVLARQGRLAVHQSYSARTMAENTAKVFKRFVG